MSELSCHAIERLICEIWSEFFERDVDPDDDFYELGGDSVAIVETVFAARQRGLALRSSEALRNPTPARLAEYLTIGAGGGLPSPETTAAFEWLRVNGTTSKGAETRAVALEQGDGVPLYVVHSDTHRRLEQDAALQWESPGPIRSLSLPAVPQGPATVADIASGLVKALRGEQPVGPYRLAGFGAGAVLAFEMGRQLHNDGDHVDFVALIGPPAIDPVSAPRKTVDELLDERISMLARRFALTGGESPDAVLDVMQEAGWYEDTATTNELSASQASWALLTAAIAQYEPSATGFPTVLVQDVIYADAMAAWNQALGDVKALWLDHGTASPRAVIQDSDLSAFMREVLAA